MTISLPKRKTIVFQPLLFKGYVSFSKGVIFQFHGRSEVVPAHSVKTSCVWSVSNLVTDAFSYIYLQTNTKNIRNFKAKKQQRNEKNKKLSNKKTRIWKQKQKTLKKQTFEAKK